MTQPRKPKGAPNSAGGQYDTYAHTTPSGLPALDRELAWERERGEGGRVEQSQQPAPPIGVTDGGYGRVDPYLPSPVRPDLVEGSRVNGDLGAIPLQFRDLTWTEWDRVRMGGANLNGANLTEARFDRVDAHDANLVRADLTGAVIRNSSLRGVRAAGVDLPHAQVTDTDMRGADLRNADVDHAALRNVDLSGARVEGVAFHRADTLSNVDLTGTGVTGASGTFDGLGQMSVVLGDRSQGVCRYERTVDGTHAGFYPPTPVGEPLRHPDMQASTQRGVSPVWASRQDMEMAVHAWGLGPDAVRVLDAHADYELGVWRDTDIVLCAATVDTIGGKPVTQ